MKAFIVASVLALAVVASATASSTTGDPRKCTTNTGTGSHAYLCAQAAAKLAAQTKLATITGTKARYMTGVSCKQHPSLLKWQCLYPASGKLYTALVTFRATSSGWKTTVVVSQK